MYIPRAFRIDDADRLAGFMRRYSFCTLLTAGDELAVSHVPVLVDRDEDRITLTGHLARANPHCERLAGGRTTAVFHGPHSYVSPGWYVDTNEVPTWNYASVHATGTARVIRDAPELAAIVDRMIDHYERLHGSPWDRRMADDYRRRQLDYITGFVLPVDELSGKYKLGQNRSRADQDRMLGKLEASSNEDSRALAAFIRRCRDSR